MMAKMFYTLDETKAALGKNEEEIKQFAREGRLREFRDGPRLMFKADQVEALKSELGEGGMAAPMSDLGPSDSGGPLGLVDTHGASGSGISLIDTDAGARGSSGSGMQLKDDTAVAADTLLSGSMGGVPSPGRPGSGASSLSGTRGGSMGGINVLGDSAANADPMAQTAISGGGITDQVSLEGVGSGSGLLDLTRESDDTSLGAELLDEIAPGGSKRGTKAGTGAIGGSAVGGSGPGLGGSGSLGGTGLAGTVAGGSVAGAAAVRGRQVAGPAVYVEQADGMTAALGGAALGAAIMLLLAGFAVASAVLDTRPAVLGQIQELIKTMPLLIMFGIGVVLTAVCAIIGGIVGKSLG